MHYRSDSSTVHQTYRKKVISISASVFLPEQGFHAPARWCIGFLDTAVVAPGRRTTLARCELSTWYTLARITSVERFSICYSCSVRSTEAHLYTQYADCLLPVEQRTECVRHACTHQHAMRQPASLCFETPCCRFQVC